MKIDSHMLLAGFAATLLGVAPALDQAGFSGTWKIDQATTQFPSQPDVLRLQNGVYECPTCAPPMKMAADGADHPMPDDPHYTLAIKPLGDTAIERTAKRDGKLWAHSVERLSPDGQTATLEYTYYGNPIGGPVETRRTRVRVGPAPAGAHPLSGSWRVTRWTSVSEAANKLTIKAEGDGVSFASPGGVSFKARLDGTPAPVLGAPDGDTVMLRAVSDHVLEEIDTHNGKVVSTSRVTLSPDGGTLTFTDRNQQTGRVVTYTARRQ